jgi:hypothetical protein
VTSAKGIIRLSSDVLAVSSVPKNQHYVWRYYLEAWAATGTFCCYRQNDKNLFVTQPKAIASETYFYEAYELTVPDEQFLESFISKASDQRLRELNRNFILMFQKTFKLRRYLLHVNLHEDEKAKAEGELRLVEKTLGERYHNGIENTCQDILDSLRQENDGFYHDAIRCGHFLYFLCNQYFRTVKMRRAITGVPRPVPGHDPRRTNSIECHIYAMNLSDGLFRERNAYQIVFLKNDANIPFITGDQPIINLLDPAATDDVELYYPLSPTLAILLTKDTRKLQDQRRRITQLEVENYNHTIYRESEDQVYSNDQGYLGSLVSIGKHLLAR